MIGKIGTAATSGTGGVNITQLTTSDDKTCYIAQPFSYNYALVNQMQIAPNGLQNTISNISFKCDVCGLMFGHLTLLNAHKRIHAQDTGMLQLYMLYLFICLCKTQILSLLRSVTILVTLNYLELEVMSSLFSKLKLKGIIAKSRQYT